MARYRLDVAALYAALDRRRNLRGLNWNQVADETELPPSFFTRLKYHHGPGADGLCTLLAWLGEGHAVAFAKRDEER